jgi:uncharacterized protein YceH (UPF0502 family)
MGDPLPALSPAEVRVLGSLIEKQITTPEYYPLTLNALTNACNQLTNREPVVSFDEQTVVRALDSLREKRLATLYSGAESRVAKYKHTLNDAILLTPAETALLCVLLLRGPQTIGELRTRAERMSAFDSLAEVETTLQGLATREPPLATKLPRQPGTKESRYAHLLSGPPETALPNPAAQSSTAPTTSSAEQTRIAQLEQEIGEVRRELAELKQQFGDFRRQFE